DNLEGIVAKAGVEIDDEIFSDGNGSLKIVSDAPTVIQLYETGDLDVENATLIYSAKVKTENVQGQVYLEMWCAFEGKGEYFSRGLDKAIAGKSDWKTLETNFFLNSGENPDNVRLNFVVAGTGTVWIDDIRLVKR
ncbi:MAG: hypothetical protein MUO34_06000, partial [Ignavibacteriaceae bacterium]|nr:hypothetical protein [Ignavibacteriaceae bacterium]